RACVAARRDRLARHRRRRRTVHGGASVPDHHRTARGRDTRVHRAPRGQRGRSGVRGAARRAHNRRPAGDRAAPPPAVTEPAPRIAPLPRGTVPDAVRVALTGWLQSDPQEVMKPLDTLARHPDLAKAFLAFNRHLLYESTLPPRIRELLILRTAAICGNEFERTAHERMARREGIDDDELERTNEGPDAPGWTREDAALMRATA